jgi:hypothetical protein
MNINKIKKYLGSLFRGKDAASENTMISFPISDQDYERLYSIGKPSGTNDVPQIFLMSLDFTHYTLSRAEEGNLSARNMILDYWQAVEKSENPSAGRNLRLIYKNNQKK